MFTVLIAEKEHIDAIRQENKLFFEPFLENKELAFCEWNPAGQDINAAVPGLIEAVGRQKKWRAVIVNNVSEETVKTRNPFDVVDCKGLEALAEPSVLPEEDLEAWESQWNDYYEALAKEKEVVYKNALEHPLQKLATWICFRPEDYVLNEVQEKQDVHDWAMEMIGRDEAKPSNKLELIERTYSKRELRLKETTRRAFVAGKLLNIAYPAEVICISARTAENDFFDPDNFWNVPSDSSYSTFADRNLFFDKMRFIVMDLLPRTHRDFRTDYIRFLAGILILASNPVPGSAMQARRLYHLEAETDDTPLCTLVTSYDRKLAATSEVIDNEMDRIRSEIPGELTDKAAEALFCTPKDVPVLLDESCDFEKVYAEKDYGLFFDSPTDEFHKWNKDYRNSEKAISYIVRQQSRSLVKSVSQTHMSSEISDVDVSRLTPLQVEDIREYTDSAENAMVASIPPDLSDMSAYRKRMDDASAEVKKVIAQRMTKKTTLALTAVCLGLYLICFLPFLFSNANTIKNTTTAIILTGVMVALLGVILVACLFFLRSAVVDAVKDYNNTAKDIVDDIHGGMKRFSRYLSASVNVRRGHAVQTYAEKNLDEYTKSLRIRKKHQEDIRRRRAYLAEGYRDYFGDRSFCDETMSRPYDYDFDQKTEYTYPAPFLAGDSRQIEFISSGNFVTVPSSYITRILVRMEGIYGK